MWFGSETIAYEIQGGTPHILIREFSGGDASVPRRIIFDHLKLDWISIEWPPKPAWQLSGGWTTFAPTQDPAAVRASLNTGWKGHSSMELFGEIIDPAIVAMEVAYESKWHRFEVAAPGFIIWIDGYSGLPDGYRWLDQSGDIIWEVDRIQN